MTEGERDEQARAPLWLRVAVAVTVVWVLLLTALLLVALVVAATNLD
jgi:hypothetical protein